MWLRKWIVGLLSAILLLGFSETGSFARGGGHSGGSHSHSSGSFHRSYSSHSSVSHKSGTYKAAKSKSISSKTKSSTLSTGKSSRAARGVTRNKHGKIARSAKAKDDFKKQHACPSTGKTSGKCPGYVIDHIKPLKRGGADSPSNMQWQTTAASKAKDKWE